jgi:DMSO/TMAO reductase YedYZ molybdopterin-dependent catalytic subunit
MPIAKAMDECLLAYGMNGERRSIRQRRLSAG